MARIPDFRAIMNDARANIVALNACNGPHDFSRVDPSAPLMGAKWRCNLCGGNIDAIAHTYYEQGLAHGRKESAKPAPLVLAQGDVVKLLGPAGGEHLAPVTHVSPTGDAAVQLRPGAAAVSLKFLYDGGWMFLGVIKAPCAGDHH
jgi:hypothetical protein